MELRTSFIPHDFSVGSPLSRLGGFVAFFSSEYSCTPTSNYTRTLQIQCNTPVCFLRPGGGFLLSLNSLNRKIIFQSEKIILDNEHKLTKILKDNLLDGWELIAKADWIYFGSDLSIRSDADIHFISQNDIEFAENIEITKRGNGTLCLKAGIDNSHGRVVFKGNTKKTIKVKDYGKVVIHYHPDFPAADSEYPHKYHHPYKYSKHVFPSSAITSYMLVVDITDLQNIVYYIHGSYALAQDIEASVTKTWNNGKGFSSIKLNVRENPTPFSGNFDGNGFKISNLYIDRPEENFIGLFGLAIGYAEHNTHITNFQLINSSISGGKYVGGISGYAKHVLFSHIKEKNLHLAAEEIAGGIIGSGDSVNIQYISCKGTVLHIEEYGALVAGAIKNCEIINLDHCCSIDMHNNMTGG